MICWLTFTIAIDEVITIGNIGKVSEVLQDALRRNSFTYVIMLYQSTKSSIFGNIFLQPHTDLWSSPLCAEFQAVRPTVTTWGHPL